MTWRIATDISVQWTYSIWVAIYHKAPIINGNLLFTNKFNFLIKLKLCQRLYTGVSYVVVVVWDVSVLCMCYV